MSVQRLHPTQNETLANGWLLKQPLLPAENLTAVDRFKFEGLTSIISERRLHSAELLGVSIVSRLAVMRLIERGLVDSPADLHERLEDVAESLGNGDESFQVTAATVIPPMLSKSRRHYIALKFDEAGSDTIEARMRAAHCQLGLTDMPPLEAHLTLSRDTRNRANQVRHELNTSGLLPLTLRFGEPKPVAAVFGTCNPQEAEQAYIDLDYARHGAYATL